MDKEESTHPTNSTGHAAPIDYALIEEQQNLIRKEIEDESPLVSEIKILEILMAEYCGN